MKRLKLIGLANGESTEWDGKFVKVYDPSYCTPGEEYDGGWLEVTDDPKEALQFPSAKEAIECWRKEYGTRSDGKPNRPLTAFSVEIA